VLLAHKVFKATQARQAQSVRQARQAQSVQQAQQAQSALQAQQVRIRLFQARQAPQAQSALQVQQVQSVQLGPQAHQVQRVRQVLRVPMVVPQAYSISAQTPPPHLVTLAQAIFAGATPHKSWLPRYLLTIMT
jgi:hypothetical protein